MSNICGASVTSPPRHCGPAGDTRLHLPGDAGLGARLSRLSIVAALPRTGRARLGRSFSARPGAEIDDKTKRLKTLISRFVNP